VNVGDDRDAHVRRATLAVLTLGAAAIGAAAYFLLRAETPSLNVPSLNASTFFTADSLDRIESYRGVTRWLWVGSTLVELVVLAVLAWKRRPLAAGVRRAFRLPEHAPVRTGAAIGVVVALCVWVAGLPMAAVRHWWARRYGLSEQSYLGWLGDEALSLLVTAVIVAVAVAGAVFLATKLGRRWWIAGAAGLAALGVLVVLAQPLVIQPLFNRFTPLADRELASRIEGLGTKLGVRIDEVEVADASRRTTAANAQVTGIGPTRRVVLYDTLLDGRFTEQQILWISAHELAHVARSHVWKAVAWFALFAATGVALVGWLLERRGGLRDPSLVPVALLAAFVLYLVTLPAQSAISRRYETEADWLALRATQAPAADAGVQRQLVLTGLTDPDPPAWVTILLGSHPSPLDRISMALAFSDAGSRPAEPGSAGGWRRSRQGARAFSDVHG
jgi:Zn-dependent protease with chaperone function